MVHGRDRPKPLGASRMLLFFKIRVDPSLSQRKSFCHFVRSTHATSQPERKEENRSSPYGWRARLSQGLESSPDCSRQKNGRSEEHTSELQSQSNLPYHL